MPPFQQVHRRSEGTMRDLIVVGFEGTHRASEVLNQTLALNADWAFDLHLEDAVAVYRAKNGRLRVEQSMRPTSREGAAFGGVFAAMLGALLAAPFTAGASAAVAATVVGAGALTAGGLGAVAGGNDAAAEKEKHGITDDFIRQVGGMIQPGQSAMFLLAESDEPARVAERFRGYGGKVLRTTLRPKQARQLQQVINADHPVTR
jgi:uncharacterized membrane protein